MVHPHKREALKSHKAKHREVTDGYSKGKDDNAMYHRENVTPETLIQDHGVPTCNEFRSGDRVAKAKFGKV
jgi:hypothetical protein